MTLSRSEIDVLKAAHVFDADWYRRNTPDLGQHDPLLHYLTIGWLDGRNPCCLFEGNWYLAENLDVASKGINPLVHYLCAGESEGRWPCRVFDPVWYSTQYSVELGRGRALAHYLAIGCQLDFRPNKVFDPAFYRKRCAGMHEPDLEVLVHYLERGFRDCPSVASDFSLEAYRENHFGGATSIDPVYHFLTAEKRRHPVLLSNTPCTASEIRTFTQRGSDFEEFKPESLGSKTVRAKLIAFFLPQFHAIPENDDWWGRGFSEWRNTQRGVPRFVGHYQPRVPRDLGFYDLLSPGVLARQIALAQQAGVHGFCFYYYHFDGKRLLERPIELFLADRSLNFPFCIMWANENWTRRWDGLHDEVLIQQTYRREHEDLLLADWCRHFADPRYIRAEGRPLLLIYRPGIIPRAAETIRRWRHKLATEFNEHPWMLMAQCFDDNDPSAFNLDGAFEFPPHKLAKGLPVLNPQLGQLDPQFTGTVVSYERMIEQSLSEPTPKFPLIRGICPSWDNDCRRQGAGFTVHGSTPRSYSSWLEHLIEYACANPFKGEPFIFVNAWNEWAEAAYLEPDVYFGAAYLNATARALTGQHARHSRPQVLLVGHDAHCHGAQLNLLHLGRTLARQFGLGVSWLLLEGGILIDRYRQIGPVTVAQLGSTECSRLIAELRSAGVCHAITNTLVVGGAVPELRREGFRVISLVHELPGLASEYKLETEANAIAKGSHVVVFAAEIVNRGFCEFVGAPLGTTHLLPQGLYADLPDVPDARSAVRAELDLPIEAKIVVGVGFADLRKGFDFFLRAASIAAGTDPPMFFVWVGNIHASLAAEMAGAPVNFRQIAFTNNVARYLHAADAMFLPSREDPFPSVVLEGMACGLPVVGFEGRSGTEDLMREHGAVVPAFDVESAVEALQSFMTLDSEAVSTAAMLRRNTVARDFNYAHYAFSLLQLLNPSWRRISVVVPNYNYGRYLSERMASIFAQTVPVFEIIVLDDASSDDSMTVLERVRSRFARDFTLIRNAANSGSSSAQWLKGVEQASGELVWIAEADDLCQPNFLERVLTKIDGRRTLFAFCDSAQIDSDGAHIGNSYHNYYKQSDAEELSHGLVLPARLFAKRFLAVRNLILNVSSVLARRDVLLTVLQESIKSLQNYSFAGDWHVYATICRRDGDVAYLPEPLNIHRRHQNSATHRSVGNSHIAEIKKVYAYLEEAYGSDDDLSSRRERYILLLQEQFGLTRSRSGHHCRPHNGKSVP